jgi:hypothetical protein
MLNLENLPPRLSRRDASEYLYIKHGIVRAASTLAKYVVTGGGPKFRRVGVRGVSYDVTELDSYAGGLLGEPMKHSSEAVVHKHSLEGGV